MPGSFIASQDGGPLDINIKERSIRGANPSGELAVFSAAGRGWLIQSGCSEKCSLGSSRVYEDDRYVCCYIGTLIDRNAIPWREILAALEISNDAFLKTFKANHCIIVYDKVTRIATLVTDKFGQHSLYVGITEGMFLASSSLLTFLHVLDKPEINQVWLHDFFFFNYPLATTALLNNSERIGPGRVVRFELPSGRRQERRYASQLEQKETSLSLREAQERALHVFSERFPRYYDNIEPKGVGVGVTGGFDARIVASYIPQNVTAQLYTYGLEGCHDMINGKKVASKLGLKHHAFAFNDLGVQELRDLALDTVYYSGGSLNALRTTLAKVYKHLTGTGLGIILTGVSSGHFFRGGFSCPQVVSNGAMEMMKDPEYILPNFYHSLFRNKDDFFNSVEMKRQHLKENLGWGSKSVSERHMSFMHYEQAPKYFGGELDFAESFGHMRSPFWDSRIRELSYEIPLSTLHNSFLLEGRMVPVWQSKAMLGYILSHGRLNDLNVDGMRPKYWANGNKKGYYLGKIIHKGPGKVAKLLSRKKGEDIPLEDWGTWVRGSFVPLLEKRLEDLPLAEYIEPLTMRQILKGNTEETMTMHWIGKFITASLVLDLVEKRLPHFSN